MDLQRISHTKWTVILLLSLLFVRAVRSDGLAITFCSSDNVAGSNQAFYAEFQSTGLCGDRCQGSFAYAVVQGHNCWCSSYAPAAQQDTIYCNEPCPGTGNEWCGSESASLFGYYQLPGGKPLGTTGLGSQASSTAFSSSVSSVRSSSVSPSPVPSSSSSSSPPSSRPFSRPSFSPVVTLVPSQSFVQPEPSSSSVYIAPSSTQEPPSSSAPPSSTYIAPSSSPPPPPSPTPSPSPSTSPSPTSSPSPSEVYTSITTVTGQVRTVLVTPTSDATLGQSSTSGGSGVSAGKVAGIVVGVVLGLGLIIGGLMFLWFRRRRNRRDSSPENSFIAERNGNSGNTSNSIPSRQVSQMSSAGLLGKAPRINTNFFPSDNDPRSAGTTSSNNADRRSVPTDQRLNPWALYSQDDRNSSVSLQDNHDYSRQLRIANPDA